MAKWILLILLVVFTSLPQAYEPYTQAQCDSITQERESIRSQFRQGYSGTKGEKLNARFTLLFKKLARHCDKPKQAK